MTPLSALDIKLNEYIDIFNNLDGENIVDQLLVKRALRDADAIGKSDMLSAYILRGIVAQYQRLPVSDALSQFEKALRINPKSDYAAINSIVCLLKLSQYKKAYELAERFHEDINDSQILATIYPMFKAACLFRLKLHELNSREPIDPIANFLNINGILDGNLEVYADAIEKVNSRHNYVFMAPAIRASQEENLLTVHLHVPDMNEENLYLLNSELIEELIDSNISSKLASLVSVGYVA